MAVFCDKCGRAFSTQFNYNKHSKFVHGLKVSPVSYNKEKFSYKCLEVNCNNSFKLNLDLINHLQVHHDINIISEEEIFNNFEEFLKWKTNTENNERCSYIMPCGKKKVSEGTEVKYYVCNRSGNPRTKVCDKADSTNNRKRLTKSQGSSKLKYSCTSQIKLTIRESCTIFMHRWKTHYGHKPEVHLKLIDKEQHVIASKLISGVSASKILDTTRDNIGPTIKRIDLLTRKDIANVKRRFHVDIVDDIRHSEDSVSIDLWVEESKCSENNTVLLYKRQGDISDEFRETDFSRHRAAVTSAFLLKELSHVSWIVQSENNEYSVDKLSEIKCCNIDCTFCQICVHMYTCTCPDFFIKNTLCKHIHFVVINANLTSSGSKVKDSTEFALPIPEHIGENNLMNSTSMTLKLHEELKSYFLDLHAKISLADFNKLNPEILKQINMHVNVIKNLLKIPLAEDQAKHSSFQSLSFEHANKTIDKQFRFHSTQKKRSRQNVPYKKPDKTETRTITDFLSGEQLYISHDNVNDHLYTNTGVENYNYPLYN